MYDLNRFIVAQKQAYVEARDEIRNGLKETHWMWYIYPQLRCLGKSSTAVYFGIADLEEAKMYADDVLLGSRIREMSYILLDLEISDPVAIFGSIDAKKLKSCMTLFYEATKEDVFLDVLNKYYDGEMCKKTLQFIKES